MALENGNVMGMLHRWEMVRCYEGYDHECAFMLFHCYTENVFDGSSEMDVASSE